METDAKKKAPATKTKAAGKGARLKLNQDFIARAVALLEAGNYAATVCAHLRIVPSTWYLWLSKAETDGGIYKEFSDAVKGATALAEMGAVAGILTAGKNGQWQALAWFLERTRPERFGRKEYVYSETTGKDGGPITTKLDLTKLSKEELNTLAGVVAKLDPEGQPE